MEGPVVELQANEEAAGGDTSGAPGPDAHLGPLQRYYVERIPEVQAAARKMKGEATTSFWMTVVFAALTAGSGIVALRVTSTAWWSTPLIWLLWAVAAVFAVFAIAGISQTLSEFAQQRDLKRELATIQRLAGLTSQEDSSDYFDQLVAINLGNLSEYYRLVKSHASRSFALAALASIAGFVLVMIGLAYAVAHEDAAMIGFAGVAAGTITELVSAVFFVLYSKTVRQLKEYHDSLLQVQNVLLSLRMIEDISDSAARSKTTSDVVLNLVGSNASSS